MFVESRVLTSLLSLLRLSSRHMRRQHVTSRGEVQVEDAGGVDGNFDGIVPLDYGNTVKWKNTICVE